MICCSDSVLLKVSRTTDKKNINTATHLLEGVIDMLHYLPSSCHSWNYYIWSGCQLVYDALLMQVSSYLMPFSFKGSITVCQPGPYNMLIRIHYDWHWTNFLHTNELSKNVLSFDSKFQFLRICLISVGTLPACCSEISCCWLAVSK